MDAFNKTPSAELTSEIVAEVQDAWKGASGFKQYVSDEEIADDVQDRARQLITESVDTLLQLFVASEEEKPNMKLANLIFEVVEDLEACLLCIVGRWVACVWDARFAHPQHVPSSRKKSLAKIICKLSLAPLPLAVGNPKCRLCLVPNLNGVSLSGGSGFTLQP